jgi:four helix bundle protein
MVGGLEGLRIFQLAGKLADETWEEVIAWKGLVRATVGEELVRAADSVGANIAERHGRFHYRDEITFDDYSRGSLKETRFWLRRAFSRRIIPEAKFHRCIGMVDELEPQLNASINSLEAKAAALPRRKR